MSIRFWSVIIFINLLTLNAYAALPKDVQTDMYTMKMKQALNSGDCDAAIKAIIKLEQIVGNIKNYEMMYHKGSCYYKEDKLEESQKTLDVYITHEGRKAKYYKEALNLYYLAEERLAPVRKLKKEAEKIAAINAAIELERLAVEKELEIKRVAIKKAIEAKRKEEEAKRKEEEAIAAKLKEEEIQRKAEKIATDKRRIAKEKIDSVRWIENSSNLNREFINKFRRILNDSKLQEIIGNVALIPAGVLPQNSSDKNVYERKVRIRPFFIMETELTFNMYDRFANATNRVLPTLPDDYIVPWTRDKHPVINVSWHDAIAFSKWASKVTGYNIKLPSETQWEYAARAGTKTRFYWGDGGDEIDCHRGRFHIYSSCEDTLDFGEQHGPKKVGSYEPNQWGLFDINGNVREWTQDCKNENYREAPINGDAQLTGDCEIRIARDTSFQHNLFSVSERGWWPSKTKNHFTGFRLIIE